MYSSRQAGLDPSYITTISPTSFAHRLVKNSCWCHFLPRHTIHLSLFSSISSTFLHTDSQACVEMRRQGLGTWGRKGSQEKSRIFVWCEIPSGWHCPSSLWSKLNDINPIFAHGDIKIWREQIIFLYMKVSKICLLVKGK